MTDQTPENPEQAQLTQFISDTNAELEKVRGQMAEMQQIYAAALADKKVLDVKPYVTEIQNMHAESTANNAAIESVHKKVVVGEGEVPSVAQQIETSRQNLEGAVTDVEKVKTEMLGPVVTTDATGNTVEGLGYIPKIKDILNADHKKNSDLFKQTGDLLKKTGELRDHINRELGPKGTTIGLSEAFKAKAKEYRITRVILELVISLLFASAIGAGVWLYGQVESWNLDALLRAFLPNSFLLGVFAWLMVFLGNRRAENKKLEEVYKHKWAMAQSYVGYEDSIQALGGDSINNLSEKLMADLLDAIKKDPSESLPVKGEKHPATDLIPR